MLLKGYFFHNTYPDIKHNKVTNSFNVYNELSNPLDEQIAHKTHLKLGQTAKNNHLSSNYFPSDIDLLLRFSCIKFYCLLTIFPL